ncbi:MAG TPA: ABC transporter permease [Terracidiphilus sp.]|jgi:lipopolysaccharide transport system permease protein|nr:ABC transporter permease [Terracidiphilus sp.]
MASSQREMVIEAGRAERHYWRDLWTYRELFLFLAWRDILVRYKQTAIGIAWSLIRPVITMLVFTVVFGRIAMLPSEGVPYPVLVVAAMLPWYFFSTAVTEGSNSLIQNANVVSKVYFPRLIVPISAVAVSLVDFVISLLLLAVLMAWYQIMPSARVLFLPVFLGLVVILTVGLTLWLAALNVRYRDFRYVVPFLMQVGMFLSPVGFSGVVVSEGWRAVYSLNPMVGIIEGFRWCLLPGYDLDMRAVWFGALISFLILGAGINYFRRTERSIADVI